MKDVILASNSKVFFTTPHFDGYPAVLVELEKISVQALKEALVEAWFACAGKRLASEYLSAVGAHPCVDENRANGRRNATDEPRINGRNHGAGKAPWLYLSVQ